MRINVLCPWYVNTSLMSFLNSEEKIGDFCHFKDLTEKALEEHGILECVNILSMTNTMKTLLFIFYQSFIVSCGVVLQDL